MSLHEQFIPGRWVDDIDVNDFINLNKKPFLDEPIFLKNPTVTPYSVSFSELLEEDKYVETIFSSLYQQGEGELPSSVDSPSMRYKIGYSESLQDIKSFYRCLDETTREASRKTTHEVYQEIATSDMNKVFRIGLFQHAPYNYTPMFVFPDIRLIPLYGTKQIVKEKRFYLTKLERYLQTTEWIQQRIAKQREIDSLKQFEKFAKKMGVSVSSPATTTKEVMDMLYVAFLAIVIENPSVGFSFTDVLSFIDVFAEKELQLGIVKEVELQEWMDEFVQKIMKARFTYSPHFVQPLSSYPFVLGETLSEVVTKTTYRFLSSLERFYAVPFVLRVIWSERLPLPYKRFLFSLYQKGIPLSIVSNRVLQNMKNPVLLPFGMHSELFDEIIFHAGGCDLEKAFYLAINGGKDVESNTNLSAITTPLRQNQISFEEVVQKLEDFFTFIILSYVELMNAVMYINDIHHNHPFRNSLISNQPFYSISFGFFHLKKVVNLLCAIEANDVCITKKQKFISDITTNQSYYEKEEMVMTRIVSYIKREMKKIPLYKESRFSVRFYEDGMYETKEIEDVPTHLSLPPEFIKGNFHMNVIQEELTEEFIRHCFSQNMTEINVSKSKDVYLANGLLFLNDYHLRKEPLED